MRTSRPARRVLRTADSARLDAERRAAAELDAWRERALPDATAPLDTEDLVSLLRDLVASLGLDPAIASGFTTSTVHYYRRKDIIDPPAGRTVAARYGLRHLWQIAGARLAGYLGLVTLAEARSAMRDAEPAALTAFVAARVADARARESLRVRPEALPAARPLPGRVHAAGAPSPSVTIALPGEAICVIPASHAALRSPAAARELAHALSAALGSTTTP